MARILDAQRLAEAKQFPAAEAAPPADAPKDAPAADAVSFIEVGGPLNGLHASADVLASPAGITRKARAASAPALAQTAVPVPGLIEPQPLFVALQPWPAAPASPSPELICFHQPLHPVSEAYRALVTRILGETAGSAPQVMLISGLTPGAGTTTVVLNLAVSAARDGKRRVAVLDLNVSRPAVAARLGISSGPWMDEVLAGRGGLEKALQPTSVSNLFVLAPEIRGDQAVTPSAEALRWILSWLRSRFDVIFVDGPSWQDIPPFAASDAVYLLTGSEDPAESRVSNVAREVARQGGRLRGILHISTPS